MGKYDGRKVRITGSPVDDGKWYVKCICEGNEGHYAVGKEYEAVEISNKGDRVEAIINDSGNKWLISAYHRFTAPYQKQSNTTDMTTEEKIKQLEQQLTALKEELNPTYKAGDWVTWLSDDRTTYKICRYTSNIDWAVEYHGNPSSYTTAINTIVRKATAEEIRKVSEPKEIVVTIGTNSKVTVKKDTIIGPDGERCKVNDLKRVIDDCAEVCETGLPWSVSIPYVKIGCCDNVTIAQLQAVVNAYNKLNQ